MSAAVTERPRVSDLENTLADRFYKPNEVAELLGVSRRTLEYYVERKSIRETRVPSARGSRSLPRFTKADILAFVATFYTVGLR